MKNLQQLLEDPGAKRLQADVYWKRPFEDDGVHHAAHLRGDRALASHQPELGGVGEQVPLSMQGQAPEQGQAPNTVNFAKVIGLCCGLDGRYHQQHPGRVGSDPQEFAHDGRERRRSRSPNEGLRSTNPTLPKLPQDFVSRC